MLTPGAAATTISSSSASDILARFKQAGAAVSELIEFVNEVVTCENAAIKISVFSDHKNGMSFLRFGTRPTKDSSCKMVVPVAVDWNDWTEAASKGPGYEIKQLRFIFCGELNAETETLLKDLSAASETMGSRVEENENGRVLQSRNQKIEVQWGIVAAGEKSHRLLSEINLFADSRMSVLVFGESGTGKELVANALHTASKRKGKFFAVNCAALAKDLIESELFGHVKGAYTGAQNSREGFFKAADNGTLFLDEIGELSLDLQAKLLRVLQERRVRPVGGNVETEINVRVVAATNRNLQEMIKKGEFREDLYYRLKGLTIHLTPLRERREELPELIEFLLGKLSEELKRDLQISRPAMQKLVRYKFPGNVRELVNVLEAGAVYATSSGVIEPEHLNIESEEPATTEIQENIAVAPAAESVSESNFAESLWGLPYEEMIEQFEKNIFSRALHESSGEIKSAAISLGMERTTFYRKAKKLGLLDDEKRTDFFSGVNLAAGMRAAPLVRSRLVA